MVTNPRVGLALLGSLVAIVLLAAAPPQGEQETLDERRERLERMSAEERLELSAKIDHFERLDPQERERIRALHQQIVREPNAQQLFQVMAAYERMILTVPPLERASLADLPIHERIHEIGQKVRKRREDELRRTLRSIAKPEDLDTTRRWGWSVAESIESDPSLLALATRLADDRRREWLKVDRNERPERGPRTDRGDRSERGDRGDDQDRSRTEWFRRRQAIMVILRILIDSPDSFASVIDPRLDEFVQSLSADLQAHFRRAGNQSGQRHVLAGLLFVAITPPRTISDDDLRKLEKQLVEESREGQRLKSEFDSLSHQEWQDRMRDLWGWRGSRGWPGGGPQDAPRPQRGGP